MSLLESAPHEIAQFIVQRTQPTEQDDDDDDAVIVLQDEQFIVFELDCFFVEDVWQREKQQLFNTQPLQRGKHLLVQPVKCTRTQGP